jgi:hypothetical protein
MRVNRYAHAVALSAAIYGVVLLWSHVRPHNDLVHSIPLDELRNGSVTYRVVDEKRMLIRIVDPYGDSSPYDTKVDIGDVDRTHALRIIQGHAR